MSRFLRKHKILTYLLVTPSLFFSFQGLVSCSKHSSTPHQIDNNIHLLGPSTISIANNETHVFKFLLDRNLVEEKEQINCVVKASEQQPTWSIVTGEMTIVGQSIELSLTFAQQSQKQNLDSIKFSISFVCTQGDTTIFENQFDLLAINKTQNKIVPFDKLYIVDYTLYGLTCSWQDPNILDCDTLVIPNTVIHIVDNVFENNIGVNIKYLIFEEGYLPLHIGNSSFKSCNALEYIALPSRLSLIDNDALAECANIKQLDISSWSKERIANDLNPFVGENILTGWANDGTIKCQGEISDDIYFMLHTAGLSDDWFNLPPIHVTYDDIGYELTTIDGSTECYLTGIKDPTQVADDQIIIPKEVTKIAPNAFWNAFPISGSRDTPTKLLTLEETSKLSKIYYGAFAHCGDIKSLDLSNSSIQYIDIRAFSNCGLSGGIQFPSSLRVLGAYCFERCGTLTSVDLANTRIRKIPKGLFYSCSMLQNFEWGDLPIYYVGDDSFAETIFRSITIPKSVLYIGDNAFGGCPDLDTLTFEDDSNLLYIGNHVLADCWRLQKLELPKSLWYIGCGTTSGDSQLTQLSIQSQNPYYFSEDNCIYTQGDHKTVVAISSVIPSLGDDVVAIQPYTFASFKSNSVTFDISNTQIKTIEESTFAYFKWADDSDNTLNIILPTTVEQINKSAFEHTDATSINIQSLNNLKNIQDLAFNWAYPLQEAILPEGVETIGKQAFYNSGIKKLYIPNSITSIEDEAFAKCPRLSEIDLSAFDHIPTTWPKGLQFHDLPENGTIYYNENVNPGELKKFLNEQYGFNHAYNWQSKVGPMVK